MKSASCSPTGRNRNACPDRSRLCRTSPPQRGGDRRCRNKRREFRFFELDAVAVFQHEDQLHMLQRIPFHQLAARQRVRPRRRQLEHSSNEVADLGLEIARRPAHCTISILLAEDIGFLSIASNVISTCSVSSSTLTFAYRASHCRAGAL